jgi:hypothetical protein
LFTFELENDIGNIMKQKLFVFSFAIGSLAFFAYLHNRRKLSLKYEATTGRLIIDLKHRMKCCKMLTIEKILIEINGEEFKTLHFKPGEKTYTGPMIVDLPEAEAGDYIKVKLTSRCSRQFTNKGSIELY